MRINREQVRLMLLAAQGMSAPYPEIVEKNDVINAIRQMGLLQIDTISVVARSPYFVLWSRLGNYEPEWLEDFHREGILFEYYAHAACFIPIEQYPMLRPDMGSNDFSWRHSEKYFLEHQELIGNILEQITNNGPVRSADFSSNGKKSNGWWDWKEEKIALENLWGHGDLMVAYRQGFQRYYDLTHRVFPAFSENSLSKQEAIRQKILISIKCLGAAREKWLADYYRLRKGDVAAFLPQMIADQEILSIPCKDWPDDILIHPDNLPILEEVLACECKAVRTSFLSPFDPTIWDRQRTLELFDFEYTIECYLPSAKRKFGYFSLPILYGDKLVGRMDAKAHRAKQQFEVRSLHFERDFQIEDRFTAAFTQTLTSCAKWHGTPEITFSENIGTEIRQYLERQL